MGRARQLSKEVLMSTHPTRAQGDDGCGEQPEPGELPCGLDPPHGHQAGNTWFRAESCEQRILCGFLTFFSHFLFVNDKDVLEDASHSARCHEMCAVVVDEFGIHAIVVGVWKLLQGE